MKKTKIFNLHFIGNILVIIGCIMLLYGLTELSQPYKTIFISIYMIGFGILMVEKKK
jgi:uncharacterized membrane protein HdeD (DUF308 family)